MTTSSTMSAVDEFERVVASEDIMYTKTHGHQLLVNNLYAEEKTAIHTNSFLHGLKYLYNAILQLRKLFHWKNFAVTNYSVETAKLFNLKQFAIYGIHDGRSG